MNRMLYAHGLGGSPQSAKAQALRAYFEPRGVAVESPSFAVPSLELLSPVAARNYTADLLRDLASESFVVVASSFGAYIALHALAQVPDVRPVCLVLLAPVINPWDSRSALLSQQVEEQWKAAGSRPVADLERGVEVPLHYAFVEELHQLGIGMPVLAVPTLVVHGARDVVVSCEQSRDFVAACSNATYRSLDDDHALLQEPEVWLRLVDEFIGASLSGSMKRAGEV